MFSYRKSTIFREKEILEVLKASYDNLVATIDNEEEDYILNVNEADYIQHLATANKILVPEIHFEQVKADSYEDQVSGKYFPTSFHVYDDESYQKEIIQFFIPVSGDIDLLRYYTPSIAYSSRPSDFVIQDNTILLEVVNFYKDPAKIKEEYEEELNAVRSAYDRFTRDTDNINGLIEQMVRKHFEERKQKILSKRSMLASLGVPLRQKENVAQTYAVPKPVLRDKITVKPTVHRQGFKPEPTLDDTNYRTILKLINDVGKNFERMPSVYKEKGEEDLRDHIIMTLDPNFEFGSVTGETFNKTGKTDIQLRYDSSVVFIAECKFWSGEKSYLASIDQLLSYLTWRDTKASIVIFVRQKDFSAVLEKINYCTSNHSNYLGFVDNSDENWFNYRFHINADRNREVKLAVQLYHLPEIKSL